MLKKELADLGDHHLGRTLKLYVVENEMEYELVGYLRGFKKEKPVDADISELTGMVWIDYGDRESLCVDMDTVTRMFVGEK